MKAVLPFTFPCGSGGPNAKGATAISIKSYIQRYLQLAMPQFMTADVELVLHQLFSHQISFETGIMTCRNQHSGDFFAKMLGQLTLKGFERSLLNPENLMNDNIEHIVKSITTKCRYLGHTTKASQDARKHQFVMMDYFGQHSLFLTIMRDDECSF